MTGGEAVVAALAANGAALAFGMPGIHNLAVFDALVDRPEFRFVVVRNEQGASYMANGVGRATGRPGICLTTTGPAACNAVTGVGDAVRDSVPMLVIASQIRADLIGQSKGAFHEVADQLGMFRAAGAWTTRTDRVEQIPAAINAAWVAATHGRPGPAYVEIPEDVLYGEAEVQVQPAAVPPRPGVTAAECDSILAMLRQTERPVVVAGGGVHAARAGDELQSLVECWGLPVVTTVNGKGAIPEDHPLSAGVLPAGEPAAAELLSRADLVLALGTSFSQVSTASWSLPYPARLIHVDIDGSLIGRSVPAALKVVADVRTALAQLNAAAAAEKPRAPSAWVAEAAGMRRGIEAAATGSAGLELVRVMRRVLPADAAQAGDGLKLILERRKEPHPDEGVAKHLSGHQVGFGALSQQSMPFPTLGRRDIFLRQAAPAQQFLGELHGELEGGRSVGHGLVAQRGQPPFTRFQAGPPIKAPSAWPTARHRSVGHR